MNLIKEHKSQISRKGKAERKGVRRMEDQLQQKVQEEAANKEARAFLKARPRLQLGLSSSIQAIAQRCYAKEIIDSEVYEGMFEGDWDPENSRARYFLRCIQKRLELLEDSKSGDAKKELSEDSKSGDAKKELSEDSKSGDAKEDIRTLATIVRKADSALEHIAKMLGKHNSIINSPTHTLIPKGLPNLLCKQTKSHVSLPVMPNILHFLSANSSF